jgi:hypothetical protein
MRKGLWLPLALALSLLLVSAAPVSAAGGAAATTATSDGTIPFIASGQCVESAEVFKDLTNSTRVFKGTAEAPGAIGTQVECYVYDQWGQPIGACEGALPGSTAACVGVTEAPLFTDIEFCVRVFAQYPDGGQARSRPCP